MKRQLFLCALAGMSVLVPLSAARADAGLSAEVGTPGIGVHVTLPVLDSLNARVGVNAYTYSFSGSTTNINYDYKLKLQTYDVLADWYPVDGSGFRLTAGAIYNNNKIDATGKPRQGTYTINGNVYPAALVGQLDGNVSFRKFAPYVGLGWGNAIAKDSRWSFTSDLGVMFQGNGSTSLSNSGCAAPAIYCAQLANDVAAENAQLSDKVHGYTMFPVVRVGVSYHF